MWFGAAARVGLAEQLEAAVLARTLSARSGLPPNCFASLNVSPHTLLCEPVLGVLAAAGSLEATVIEVTEQSAVDDYEALGAVLEPLRRRGALIAVDDAGAGYASLSHVTQLRPDFVKIDRGLVSDCDRDEAKLAALEMLGVLAGRIDAWVIAEGIERPEELEALMRLRVPLAQGYYLGRPADVHGDIQGSVKQTLAVEIDERRTRDGVALLTQRAPCVPMRETTGHVAAALLTNPHASFIVALDAHERPVGLVHRHAHPVGEVRPVTRIIAGEEPAEVARRAKTRPIEARFDPLVVCDGRGRYMGILTMDRLMTALAG